MDQVAHVEQEPALQIRHKHSLAVRWLHWLNFPLLFTMIWSGLLIYWADSIPYQGHLGQVYRVGFGAHTLFRLFPPGSTPLSVLKGNLPGAWASTFSSCGCSC